MAESLYLDMGWFWSFLVNGLNILGDFQVFGVLAGPKRNVLAIEYVIGRLSEKMDSIQWMDTVANFIYG